MPMNNKRNKNVNVKPKTLDQFPNKEVKTSKYLFVLVVLPGDTF